MYSKQRISCFHRFCPLSADELNAGTVAHISVHFLTRTTTTKSAMRYFSTRGDSRELSFEEVNLILSIGVAYRPICFS